MNAFKDFKETLNENIRNIIIEEKEKLETEIDETNDSYENKDAMLQGIEMMTDKLFEVFN